MSESATVKNTSIFSLFTMLSRVFGLIRDSLKAYALGTSTFAVAYDIAFRLPNIFRNLVAEGALSQAFLPLFQEEKRSGIEAANRAAGAVLVASCVVLLCFVSSVWVFLPEIVDLLLKDEASKSLSTKIVYLGRILFPFILFMSVTAIYMSIQYSFQAFAWASVGPAILNLFIIFSFSIYLLLASSADLWTHAVAFAWVTLIGAPVQLFFQVRAVHRLGVKPRWKLRFWEHSIIRKLGYLMLPAVFGLAVQELGQLIDLFLASLLYEQVPGAVSSLSYAHRLIHLPIGVFGVAIATASLSRLSELAVQKKINEFKDGISLGIRLNAMLLIPAAVSLIFLAEPIIALLFERGEFTRDSTLECAHALVFYAIGIPGYSLQKLFFSSYYAQKNSRIPAIITTIILIANVTFSYLLMKPLLHGGLALGSVLAAYLGASIYAVLLYRKEQLPVNRDFIISLSKLLAANSLLVLAFFMVMPQVSNYNIYIQLVVLIPAAAILYISLLKGFRCNELTLFIELLRKRRKA